MTERQEQYEVALVDNSPAAVMMAAIEKGLDLEKVSKAMELQERWEANQAKKAFHAAKAEFKADMPTVYKDKKNPKYNSMYVSGGNLTNTINPELGKHGLEISFDISQDNETGMITVTAILTHSMGHSERVSMSAPPDDGGLSAKGNPLRNAVQAIKSTRTSLMVSTFELILGIMGTDESADDDGNSSGGKQIELATPAQVKEINDKYREANGDEKQFQPYLDRLFKVSTPEELTTKQADQFITTLNARIKGLKK